MKRIIRLIFSTILVCGLARVGWAEVKIAVEHRDRDRATAAFNFTNIPAPSRVDLGTSARFSLVSGEPDENGGGLGKLHDGKLPGQEDEPEANFFFAAGTGGGRVQVDLGNAVEVKQVNSYSWHPGTRGPQVYTLYASDGQAGGFEPRPRTDASPENCGWKLITKVDTRPDNGAAGGQYGVSITDTAGKLGVFRYLLFDISRTENEDAFGNTFYSEIDIVGTNDVPPIASSGPDPAGTPAYVIKSRDGACEISIDTSGAPDLKAWAEEKLAPVLAEWYPRLTTMLASDGYEPPRRFSVVIRPGNGVAATGGTRITANANWLKSELDREALGALLHEEVHVIQQYGRGRRNNPDARPFPGWLTEGIPDYIRWFVYEPQSHGADERWMRSRRNLQLRYDIGYRVSANFLNYVVGNYDKDLVRKLNAACRHRTYTEDLWKDATGKTLSELADEWKAKLEKALAAEPAKS